MKVRMIAAMVTGILLLLLLSAALAAPDALAVPLAFTLPWWTVDSGGSTSTGGGFTLQGTIGQPDPGPRMSGGDYSLVGGFWGGTLTAAPSWIFLPLVSP